MRKSMLRSWAVLAILCCAIQAVASLCAEVPPGPKWLQTAVFYQVYPQSYFDSTRAKRRVPERSLGDGAVSFGIFAVER